MFRVKNWLRKLFGSSEDPVSSTSPPSGDPLSKTYEVISAKEERVGFDALEDHEKAFILVWYLETEINNGGFDQYFFNSAGDRSKETREALIRIDAAKTAAILDEAMKLFPEGTPSKERDTRQAQLEVISPDSDRFEALDERFLAYEEDISSLALQYYEKHR